MKQNCPTNSWWENCCKLLLFLWFTAQSARYFRLDYQFWIPWLTTRRTSEWTCLAHGACWTWILCTYFSLSGCRNRKSINIPYWETSIFYLGLQWLLFSFGFLLIPTNQCHHLHFILTTAFQLPGDGDYYACYYPAALMPLTKYRRTDPCRNRERKRQAGWERRKRSGGKAIKKLAQKLSWSGAKYCHASLQKYPLSINLSSCSFFPLALLYGFLKCSN